MTPAELRASFKRDVADRATPPLWSDEEIYEYANWSIDQFCIGWGGFVDSSSSLTQLPIIAGQAFTARSPRIIKIHTAVLMSTYARLDVMNLQDMLREQLIDDYGFTMRQVYDMTPGPVTAMITDMEPNKVRWVHVPIVNDSVQLHITRLSKDRISCTGEGCIEVPDEFMRTILLGMKSQAYLKQDAETFDKTKAQEFLVLFDTYLKQARSVREARESKVRSVAYGGL